MLEILKAIDLLSQNRVVRWALMVTIVIITTLLVYYRVQYYLLTVANRELTAANLEYASKIEIQNEAVQKAADEYQSMALQIHDANAKAQSLQSQLAKRKVEIRQIVLKGTCDQMVGQVLEDIRK